MQYLSTRGGMAPKQFSEILLEGLAPDGGLTVPEHYPQVSAATLAAWRQLDYASLAYEVIGRYASDIPGPDLEHIIRATYTRDTFGSDAITPLRPLGGGVWILGLSNGPTLAFKDIAMQFLGHLFQHVLERSGQSLNILGATSGDTGSAAEHAMRGKPSVRVFMLSPHGKMSPFQAAQMYSLDEPNIFNLAVEGVFDDCQDMVKAVSRDAEFKSRYRIGAVNSINWARVVAQVVYYFRGHFAASTDPEEEVDFAVPSGNFGNIFAGYIARRMGLPIGRLILATNENDVLDEFFRTGRYRVRSAAETHETSSPSMDISKASNFERFVFDLLERDSGRTCSLFQDALAREGSFTLDAATMQRAHDRYGFASGRSTHADRLGTIRDTWMRFKTLIDTHTADGLKVAREHLQPGVPMLVLETAQPVKFADTIREALGIDPPLPAGLQDLVERPRRFVVMPADVTAIKDYIRDNA